MKIYIIFFLFFFIVSCQTAKGPSGAGVKSAEEETVTDVIGSEPSDGDFIEDDLEGEFADSEDFEKEMADEAFPTDEQQAQKEQAEEEKESADSEEIPSPEVKEETVAETESAGADEAEALTGDEEDVEAVELDEPGESIDSNTGIVINNIRYESGENKIYVDGTGSFSYQSRENKANNQLIIEIPGAVLSESLRERPFVMKDFNTDMALLQADQKDSNTVRIVVQMRENAGMPVVDVSETGSLLISSGAGGGMASGGSVAEGGGGGSSFPSQDQGFAGGEAGVGGSETVLPAKTLEEFFLSTPQFTGRPISIHFKEVAIREVLEFISEGTGLNMVLSGDISGTISIKLRNVPWDQALITVMKVKGLSYIREGNIIRIMKLDALKSEQEKIQKMIKDREVLVPLKVQVIPVVYAVVQEVETQIKGFLTKDRGKVASDSETNSLIVTDTPKVIEHIETMVKQLDKIPMQVMIEAKIVEARETFARNLGIQWGFQGTPLNLSSPDNNVRLGISGGLDVLQGGVTSASTLVTRGFRVAFSPVGDLDLTLGLSELENLAHVLSAPRVMVLNGEKATISQQTETIDAKTVIAEGGGGATTTPERIQATLEFGVSPTITAVGSIFMEIDMKREFFGAQSTVQGARPKNSRSAKTKVLVNNGQTIVIGGIYQNDETRADEGVPLLKYIPILNWFFSTVTKSTQRNELLLFLTPRIVDFASSEKN